MNIIKIISILREVSFIGIIVGLALDYVLRDIKGSIVTLISMAIFIVTYIFLDNCYIDEDDLGD